ncbi:hypothetical protein [Flavobacterium hydatis]|uniref:Lipoprotein n=1 Tax=Flavobacterium hydatis TaxID=991 RepID=A0ABX4CFM6_FLAHY|nr:hypothetical protein [Flavobacterium hydatis]OXA93308.1 hypothetical protein B0A62_13760 [Flavobacterium hydatis]
MLNKRFSIIIVTVYVLQFIVVSCKRKEEIPNQQQKFEKDIRKRIDCKIEFPDTVYIDQLYDGMVKYKSMLDTITTSFDDKKKNRYVIFYLTIVDKPDPDYKHLKKVASKFGADNNKEISIYDIKFTKTGIYYIDGIINDFVIINENKKDLKGNELVRLIENEERVIHKVVVINSPESNNKKS